jgi:hypothetical protein
MTVAERRCTLRFTGALSMSSDAKVEGHEQQRHHTPGAHTIYLLGVLVYSNQPQPNRHNVYYSHVVLLHEVPITIRQHRFWNDMAKPYKPYSATMRDDALLMPMSVIHDSSRNSI